MDAGSEAKSTSTKSGTTTERASDRELVVTRRINGPARAVFEAWTRPELFSRWWTPASFGIKVVSCDMDVRTGGTYRLVLSHPNFKEPMAFFGRYLEVTPNSRIVWTNDEGGEAGQVTTVTLEESGGTTLVVLRDLYPSKDALDEALASESVSGYSEQFDQLDELLGISRT